MSRRTEDPYFVGLRRRRERYAKKFVDKDLDASWEDYHRNAQGLTDHLQLRSWYIDGTPMSRPFTQLESLVIDEWNRLGLWEQCPLYFTNKKNARSADHFKN